MRIMVQESSNLLRCRCERQCGDAVGEREWRVVGQQRRRVLGDVPVFDWRVRYYLELGIVI